MLSSKFSPLHRQLVLTVSSAMLLLASITAIIVYIYEYKHAQLVTKNTLTQLIDTVSRTAAIAAYANNEQIAQDVLHGLLNNAIIQSVKITSDGGFSLQQKKAPFTVGTHVSHKIISPFNDGETIGHLDLYASAAYNLNQAKRSAIFSIIISISLITITTLIILWRVKSTISKPLSRLSNTLHTITIDKTKRIPSPLEHKNDEFSRLTADINSLLDRQEVQFNSEHQLRQQIEDAEQQLRHTYNTSSAGLFLLNKRGTLLSFNNTLKTLLHTPNQDNTITTVSAVFKQFINQQADFRLLLKQALKSDNLESSDFKLINPHDNTVRWLHCLISTVINTQGHTTIEGVLFDITERVKNEKDLQYDAEHDSLTGLLRRQATKNRFESYLKDQTNPNASFLFMDLDGFKQINDTHGHLAGDQVLSIVAERLFQCIRSSDLVCRLGGDEFLIILLNNDSIDLNAGELKVQSANKILNSIQQPIGLCSGLVVSVGISIGITDTKLSATQDFDTLIKDADAAMYQVKNSGKNAYATKEAVSL